MRAHRKAALAAGLGVAALAAPGCGSDDHPNEPRPPAPIDVTAKVDEQKVAVSPDKFGAGLVVFTVSNQSSRPATLTVDGPVDDAGDEIAPGQVGTMKLALEEGDYEVTAGPDNKAEAAGLSVGPARETSQNQLLLP